MKYFKCYSNITESEVVSSILNKYGKELFADYIILLAFLTRHYDGINPNNFTFHINVMRSVLGHLRVTKTRYTLDKLSALGAYSVSINGELVHIKAPILLKLQAKRYQKSTKVDSKLNENLVPYIDNKINRLVDTSSERIDDQSFGPIKAFSENDDFKLFLIDIKKTMQERWIKLYTVDFVSAEFLKMINWLEANKNKAPRSNRGKVKFISGWLDRGFERHRKTIPSNSSANNSKYGGYNDGI